MIGGGLQVWHNACAHSITNSDSEVFFALTPVVCLSSRFFFPPRRDTIALLPVLATTDARSIMHIVLTVFSALATLLLVLILPGQLKSQTIPAVTVICWLFACNNIHFANALIWADNTDVQASVWCDICAPLCFLRVKVLYSLTLSDQASARCDGRRSGRILLHVKTT